MSTTIRAVEPDVVMVELCESRKHVLSLDEETILRLVEEPRPVLALSLVLSLVFSPLLNPAFSPVVNLDKEAILSPDMSGFFLSTS